MKKTFEGSNFNCGFYAYIEGGNFVIGEERGREGGTLYCGLYKGEDTPYLNDIKLENTTLYNNIIKYFNEQKHLNEHKIEYEYLVMSNTTLSDMKKLSEIFSLCKENLKKQFPQLYYAILAVLDSNK